MDPVATWGDLCDAMRSGDLETALERAEALVEWRSKGGDQCDGIPWVRLRDFCRVLKWVTADTEGGE